MNNNDDLLHFLDRVPLNTPGKYFITDHCRDCGLCRDTAPDIFKADLETGHSYVWHQPVGVREEKRCRDAMEACPTQSIYDFGTKFNRIEHPPRNGDIDKVA